MVAAMHFKAGCLLRELSSARPGKQGSGSARPICNPQHAAAAHTTGIAATIAQQPWIFLCEPDACSRHAVAGGLLHFRPLKNGPWNEAEIGKLFNDSERLVRPRGLEPPLLVRTSTSS